MGESHKSRTPPTQRPVIPHCAPHCEPALPAVGGVLLLCEMRAWWSPGHIKQGASRAGKTTLKAVEARPDEASANVTVIGRAAHNNTIAQNERGIAQRSASLGGALSNSGLRLCAQTPNRRFGVVLERASGSAGSDAVVWYESLCSLKRARSCVP